MNIIKFTIWTLSLFIMLACSAWYFKDSLNNTKLSIDEKSIRKSIDATITGLSIQKYDKNGAIEHFLESPLVRHIPKNNIHILTTPHIIIHEENKAPWEITSKKATTLHGGKKVTFSEDVIILQKKHKNTDEISFYTQEITYFPKKKYAITKKNIKLQQANSTMLSKGIKAYLAENRVQFLSNARGHYEQKNG